VLDMGNRLRLHGHAQRRRADRGPATGLGLDRRLPIPLRRTARALPVNAMDTVLTAPAPRRAPSLPSLDTLGAHMLALLWIAPLLYACWAAFRDPSAALRFDLTSGWTLANFGAAWER